MHHKKEKILFSEVDCDNNEPELKNSKKNEKYSLRQRHQRRQSGRNKNVSTTNPPVSVLNDNNDQVDNFVNLSSTDSLTLTSTASATNSTTSNRNYTTPTTGNNSKNNNSIKKSTKPPKSKTKAAPLSKYRRKTANARERTRMREINSAFENLRKCVPLSIGNGNASPTTTVAAAATPTNEKLTKITTLRLAMKYIRTLNDVLQKSNSDPTNYLINNNNNTKLINHNNNNNDNTNNNNNCSLSNNNSINLNHHHNLSNDIFGEILVATTTTNGNSLFDSFASSIITNTSSIPPTTTTTSNNTTTNSKKRNNHKIIKDRSKPSPYSSNKSISLQNLHHHHHNHHHHQHHHHNKSPYLSACSTPSIDNMDPLGLLLESDGESLHLSEPCLSPLSQSFKSFPSAISVISGGGGGGGGGTSMSSSGSGGSSSGSAGSCGDDDGGQTALELGLLLDSDTDSLQLSESCLSPLSALDSLNSLNPFGDLLHTGFSEHSNLDMYLT